MHKGYRKGLPENAQFSDSPFCRIWNQSVGHAAVGIVDLVDLDAAGFDDFEAELVGFLDAAAELTTFFWELVVLLAPTAELAAFGAPEADPGRLRLFDPQSHR